MSGLMLDSELPPLNASMSAPLPAFSKEDALARLGGDEPLLKILLTMMQDEFPDTIAKLFDAYDARDADQIRRNAHSIKGAAANVSALALSNCALRIEQRAKEDDIAAVAALLEELHANYVAFLSATRELS